MLIQMSLCCLNPFQIEWRIFVLPKAFFLLEQLVGIFTNNNTVKWYKVSGTNEFIVLSHFRITAEIWSHLQVILKHMSIISRLQISEICFSARYYSCS